MTTKTEFLRFKRLIKDAEALPISIKGTRSGSIERTAILRNRDAVVLKTKELIKRNKFLSKKCAEDLADLNGLEYHTKRGLLLEALYLAEKDFLILDPTLGSLTVRSIGKNNAEWSLIHHDIIKVSKQKFEDEHYADSVESAFKEINFMIKEFYIEKTGKESDGSDLMFKVFCSKPPLIILNNLETESDRNIQEGYGQIFAGSMKGIRNPSAHANLIMKREDAMRLLMLASHLVFMIDGKLK